MSASFTLKSSSSFDIFIRPPPGVRAAKGVIINRSGFYMLRSLASNLNFLHLQLVESVNLRLHWVKGLSETLFYPGPIVDMLRFNSTEF